MEYFPHLSRLTFSAYLLAVFHLLNPYYNLHHNLTRCKIHEYLDYAVQYSVPKGCDDIDDSPFCLGQPHAPVKISFFFESWPLESLALRAPQPSQAHYTEYNLSATSYHLEDMHLNPCSLQLYHIFPNNRILNQNREYFDNCYRFLNDLPCTAQDTGHLLYHQQEAKNPCLHE